MKSAILTLLDYLVICFDSDDNSISSMPIFVPLVTELIKIPELALRCIPFEQSGISKILLYNVQTFPSNFISLCTIVEQLLLKPETKAMVSFIIAFI